MVKRSPLYELQKKLGARFTEFAGFEMPIQYSSIKEEHLCVRRSVGLFDVSHMSNTWIIGEQASDLISFCTVEDASRIGIGKSQYTEILREDGTVIDDTIFMHVEEGRYMMIPNAGMAEIVTKWLNDRASEHDIRAQAQDVSSDFVILAVQGPRSGDTLQKLTKTDLKSIGFFANQYADIAGVNCIISHTGYTGELGFELQINPTKEAEKVFNEILKAGKEFGIKPVGLGARDTLRLEKCFILAGNEFEGGRTPLEATLGWTIRWDHDFIGKDALLKQKERDDFERLTKMVCVDKGIPRHGCTVQKDGKNVGKVSSGTLSPCLNKGIAMAYVHPDHREIGSNLEIIIRDKPIKAEIIKPPFVPKDWAQQK